MARMKRKTPHPRPADSDAAAPKTAASKTAASKAAGGRAVATPPPPRVSRGLLAVGALSSKVTRPLLGKRGLGEGDLVGRWAMIVGPALASLTAPERLRFARGRRDAGELTVRVSSGPVAVEVQHDAPRLIDRINGHFGYAAVARLKVIQAPLPRPPRRAAVAPRPLTAEEERDLDALLAGVADDALRATLKRLGQAVRGRPDRA
jgi:hypothetical protein